ncbi:TniB protein [Azonexus fungiphilus]|uniref:TniB protein n=1 Tax=Azonexus fungiphilus TaxID=146940 RepID=A0A495WC65_9RHOO|nr:TniB family NTP-binding protein [Azonexus fungiphilus]RKT58787.1 TniB protein [Azonexus fungiphilus]
MMNTMADLHSEHLFAEPTSTTTPALDPIKERTRAMAGSPDDRAQYVLDVPIAFDEYRRANKYIDALLARAKVSKKPGGLWIIGEGGRGKSFILERLLKRLKPVEGDHRRLCPVLYLTFEARPSIGEIYIRLLMQLGQDPRSLKGLSLKELRDTLRDAVKTTGVLLIAFDEAQHLWILASRKIKGDAGGALGATLKRLYDFLGVAFVFIGTPPLDEIRRQDEQTTRWPGLSFIKAFSYNDEYLGVLATLDQCLPMPEKANLIDSELSKSIFDSSRGSFRLLKMLLADAVRIASRKGNKRISREDLAEAHFLVHCSEETPFGPVPLN